MTDNELEAHLSPLQRHDPTALGGIELSGRLSSTDSGVIFAGRCGGRPVTVAMLNDGAERDPYARARFRKAAEAVVADGGSPVVAADSAVDIAPWVAVRADSWATGLSTARALLAPVGLEDISPVGAPAGPMFRPHWFHQRGTGRWRMWPLPWPSPLTAASRWTFVAAFALVLAIAAIALWIAVKVFEDQPPVPPGPGPGPLPLPTPTSPLPTSPSTPLPTPTPTTGPGSPGGGSGTTPPPPIV